MGTYERLIIGIQGTEHVFIAGNAHSQPCWKTIFASSYFTQGYQRGLLLLWGLRL
jgi:hypothetical protein